MNTHNLVLCVGLAQMHILICPSLYKQALYEVQETKMQLLSGSPQTSTRVAGRALANICFHSAINLQQLMDYFRNPLCIAGAEFQIVLQCIECWQAESFSNLEVKLHQYNSVTATRLIRYGEGSLRHQCQRCSWTAHSVDSASLRRKEWESLFFLSNWNTKHCCCCACTSFFIQQQASC